MASASRRPADATDDDPLTFGTNPAFVLPALIERQARDHPDAPFVVEVETGRSATYAEFWELARCWAAVLRDSGIGVDDRVASLLPGSIDAHALWIGCSLVGAWEVAVDPELRGRFLEHALDSCEPAMVIARPEHVASKLQGSDDLRRALLARGDQTMIVPRGSRMVHQAQPVVVDHLPSPLDVACVVYTSGTTGPAKGVVISWGQFATTIGRIPRSWLGPSDASYCPWPTCHVTGRSPLFAMADVGGRVVVRERFSKRAFWSDVRDHGCTVTSAGAVAGLLLAEEPRPADRDHGLRHAFLGTGPTALRFVERFGVNGISCYGSTEVGFPICNPNISAQDHESIGWLRAGYEARVVDRAGADVVAGAIGELLVRPPSPELVLLGYLGSPDVSPVDGAGWLHTGDHVMRHADGRFVFAGRMQDTIRRLGENISSAELERAIVSATGLTDCAVVATPSPVTGMDIVLCVTRDQRRSIDPAALHERLRDALPRVMVPSHVCVVDELPTTPTGKVRRRELAESLDLTTCWSAPAEPTDHRMRM